MSGQRRGHRETTPADAFTELVEDGTFDADFEHADALRAFVADVMDDVLGAPLPDEPAVLDAGCGTGAWLSYLAREVLPRYKPAFTLYGFDVTPAMVDVTARRLGAPSDHCHVQAGSILDPNAYRFPDGRNTFHIVFVFDVIQQLPRRDQLTAVHEILDHLSPGGVAVIFDHDRHSPYGRKMGFRKFLTWYLRIPLLPRYYCQARYPALEKIRRKVGVDPSIVTSVRIAPDGKKRALIISRRTRAGTVEHDISHGD